MMAQTDNAVFWFKGCFFSRLAFLAAGLPKAAGREISMKKILLIDDEEDFAQMIKLNLEDIGEYEVLVETKGEKAIDAARSFQPDLILLDIMLPDMSGDAIISKLKEDRTVRYIPVVFLTALVTDRETDINVGSSGTYHFLAKPVSIRDLVSCINKHAAS